ncbi:hypothetical protein V2I01_38820 [Micromonospora sp. BRA006-A]|nr:hypothetical protein [Micromonospora sp. BRA006-A]
MSAADKQGRREARIAWWSAIALLRSLVSSPRASAQTLRTRSATATAGTAEEADRLGAPLTSDFSDSDALEGLDVAPGAETGGVADAGARLAELADQAAQLGADRGPEAGRPGHPPQGAAQGGYHPIVFCRYIPTAEYVAEHLDGKLGKKTVVQAVTGTLSPQQRIQRIEELAEAAGDDPAARRVLIATDCLRGRQPPASLRRRRPLRPGLEPHPPRSARGRVDRYGQKRTVVRVITLYGSDNGIDGKVLDVLIKKHRQIRKDLGISVSVPDAASSG